VAKVQGGNAPKGALIGGTKGGYAPPLDSELRVPASLFQEKGQAAPNFFDAAR
jgi:hypothetical protein